MRITFVQSGGFVGAIKGRRIDTGALEPGERARVESLVMASGITASFTRRSEAARDARQYQIAIERDAAVLRVTCDDRCVPETARPLVGFLAAKAVPQRPGFGDDVMAEPATDSADQWGRFVGDVVARWSDNGRDREWRQVHRMLYEACRCGGVAAVTAKAMYYAVWHFGPRWRIEDRKTIVAGRPQIERVVHDETPSPPTAAQAAAVERYFATHDVDAEAIPTLTIPGAEARP